MNSITSCLSNMFVINGKTNQKDYIIFFIFCIIVATFLSGLICKFFGGKLGCIIGLFLYTIPMITATARRLHDSGYSALWAILCFFTIGVILEIICCFLPAKHS